jgi:hypothetical protein
MAYRVVSPLDLDVHCAVYPKDNFYYSDNYYFILSGRLPLLAFSNALCLFSINVHTFVCTLQLKNVICDSRQPKTKHKLDQNS